MMTLHQRSVNVLRSDLLLKLKENLTLHKSEYATALNEFKQRLVSDLQAGLDLAKSSAPHALREFSIDVDFPENHAKDYEEVIEMLEMSVDENIQLDAQSFRAYIKNEWTWSRAFADSVSNYKIGSFLKAS